MSGTYFASPKALGDEKFQQMVKKFEIDFDAADKDKSGKLSFPEFKEGVLSMNGFKPDDGMLFDMFFGIDKNHDGITRDEYKNALKEIPKLTQAEATLRAEFRKMDTDGSGFLSSDELVTALSSDNLTSLIQSDEASALFDKLQNDGKVDYEEFIKAFDTEITTTMVKQLYDQLNKNNDGAVHYKELIAAVEGDADLQVNRNVLCRILNEMWNRGMEQVTYADFCDAYMRAEAPFYYR